MEVFSQANPPESVTEKVRTKDLPVLDKVTITKVTEFMQKFQSDASFTPPTVDVMYDSDKYDVNIDTDFKDVDSVFIDIEEMDDDIQRARENF